MREVNKCDRDLEGDPVGTDGSLRSSSCNSLETPEIFSTAISDPGSRVNFVS